MRHASEDFKGTLFSRATSGHAIVDFNARHVKPARDFEKALFEWSACVAALCWGTDDAARMHGRAQANYSLHVTVTTNGIRFVTGRPKSCQSGAHEEHPLSVDLCFSPGRLIYWSEFRNEPLGREE